MNIQGKMIIGDDLIQGTGPEFQATNPASGQILSHSFYSGQSKDVEQACELAMSAFDAYRGLPLTQRADFLEAIADEIVALDDELIQRAVLESGLPEMRIMGERGRTAGQLRLFAEVVRSGNWLDARIDPALPDRTPLPRADLRMRHIPLGPVAIFGASNFPLAFSVAGGDTASALAAGCPVVVKAQPAHPGTSELVGLAISRAIKKCDIPAGTFSLLFDSGYEVGAALVTNPSIKAVGFTGSRQGGLALMDLTAKRTTPIPVFAEMSSINPVFLLPNALQAKTQTLAQEFVASVSLGAGQFCTNPGLVIGIQGKALSEFNSIASDGLSNVAAQTMLTPGIYDAYTTGIETLGAHAAVNLVASGQSSPEPNRCQASLFSVSAEKFLNHPELQQEIFGATSLIVECSSESEMITVANHLNGELTATLQLNQDDAPLGNTLLPILERKVGRILCNGYPTGVEVCHAMVHGGPFPATSDGRSTSVGSAAISRFLRPVSYQDFPDWLIPQELRDANEAGISRLIDGELTDKPKDTAP